MSCVGRLILRLWTFVYGRPAHTPVIWGGRVIIIPNEQGRRGRR